MSKPPLTFWACAGDVFYRDHNGQAFPLPLAMTAALHMRIWRELPNTPASMKAALSTIRDQLVTAREDAIRWRMAS